MYSHQHLLQEWPMSIWSTRMQTVHCCTMIKALMRTVMQRWACSCCERAPVTSSRCVCKTAHVQQVLSVLHVSEALCTWPQCLLLHVQALPDEEYRFVRRTIIGIVLATDMVGHAKLVKVCLDFHILLCGWKLCSYWLALVLAFNR